MEMDDLKNGWKVLNERLSQNEQLNKRIIQEMIRKRTTSAYRRIMYVDFFTTLLGIVCYLFILADLIRVKPLFRTESFIVIAVVFFVLLTLQIIYTTMFSRFTVESGNLIDSAKWLMKYKRWVNKNKKYAPVGLVLFISLLFYFERFNFSSTELFIRLGLGIAIGIFLIWISNYFYGNNLREIENGLKELEELEREELH